MRGRAVLGVCLALPLAAPVAAQSALRSTLGGPREREALERAFEGAIRRLERPACQGVFSSFEHAPGRTLQHELDAIGQTGSGFMAWILFVDGRGERRCRDGDVLAFTQRGSRSVWICPRQFTRASERDPAYAEIVLIHEELHALGLGEDPPSSQAISQRVESRCGGRD
jgi:hypothetical protein